MLPNALARTASHGHEGRDESSEFLQRPPNIKVISLVPVRPGSQLVLSHSMLLLVSPPLCPARSPLGQPW